MGEFFTEVFLPMMKKLVEAVKSYDEVKRLVRIPSTWGSQDQRATVQGEAIGVLDSLMRQTPHQAVAQEYQRGR